MLTALSIENQITRRLDNLGATADFLAALAQIPPSRLSQAFRGIKPLDNVQGVALLALLDRLDELVKAAAPLPLSWKSPIVIRDLLTSMEDGQLRIAVIKADPPAAKPKAYAIRLRDGKFFTSQGYDCFDKLQINASMNFLSARMLTEDVARQLIDLLARAGFRECRAVLNQLGESEPAFRLDQVWRDAPKK